MLPSNFLKSEIFPKKGKKTGFRAQNAGFLGN
jgi:hypothetical protein